MRTLLLLLLTGCGSLLSAQSPYNRYQWKAQPELHPVAAPYREAAAVFIADKKISEFVIEKDGFFLYKTVHRIVHINNDQGIESFNKVYLPFGEGVEMVDVKARTILPGGKVIELDRDNIKDLKDDDGQTYKIFAIDGLVPNCEVEYLYTVKRMPSFFGTDLISSRIPTMRTHWELIAPAHLVFETKSFNGLAAARDSVAGEKRHLWLDVQNTDEAREEKYSMYDASLKRIEYKLCFNKAKDGRERLFTWNELAKKAFVVYTSVNDKEKKKLKEVAADLRLSAMATEEQKIAAVENYLKKHFIVREDMPSDDADDLGRVLKAKVISERAAGKMYAALFSAAGVPFQIVLCGDRTDYVLERNFENWNNAQNFLLYFPASKKFLAPTQTEYRYPWIPPTWAGTLGLFCVPTTIGNFTTAFADLKGIAFEPYEHNFSNLTMQVTFDKDDALLLKVKQLYGGYTATNYKAPFAFMPQEEQDKFLKELVKFGTHSENILTHSLENRELDQKDPYQPFIINATVRSSQLMERAGNKFLVKIGELIGQQSELYDTRPRTTAIALHYPHALVREIELTLPEGYAVQNLGDLNISQVVKDGDKVTIGFVCTYTLTGNVLKVQIREDYRHALYPVEQYEAFKKIINTAADFNKVVLILDKKG